MNVPQLKIDAWIIQFVSSNPTPANCVRQKNIFISTGIVSSEEVLMYASKWEGYLQAKTEMFLGELTDKISVVEDHTDPIVGRIHKIIREQLGLQPDTEISPAMNIVEDFGADSLDLVELVISIEDEFGIEIKDHEIDSMKNGEIYIVKNFIDLVKKTKGESKV